VEIWPVAVLDSLLARLLIQSTSMHNSHYAGKAVSNMAAPLVQRVREQRVLIRFLLSQGAKTVEIHGRMLLQYGDSCLAQRKVYE
jgi:adenosylmethionine-8-amino-7-oxononanoate aminotransferase